MLRPLSRRIAGLPLSVHAKSSPLPLEEAGGWGAVLTLLDRIRLIKTTDGGSCCNEQLEELFFLMKLRMGRVFGIVITCNI